MIKNPLSERFKNAYVLFNMRQGRGSGLIARPASYITLAASLKILFPSLHIIMFVPLTIVWIVATYYLGLLDETRIKLWQLENEKMQTHNNPYYVRLEKKVDKLLKKTMK